MKRRLLISLFALISSLLAFSQESSDAIKLGAEDLVFSDENVEVNVVSASRSSKSVNELPITIYVVSREDIQRNHYYSLTDILKNLPGIRVSQPGTGELGEGFTLRGLIGNMYTLILINGLPIKPSAVIGMPILNQLPIRQAEKIEIIYGPAGAIYGADAVSGVINIITREADKGTFVLADVSIGQNEFRNTDFMVGGKSGRNKNILQYSFYGGLNEINDQSVYDGYDGVYNPLTWLQESGKQFTIGSNTYQPTQINEQLLAGASIATDDFIRDNYNQNYSGSLTAPNRENLPSKSNLLGIQLDFRGVRISFNNMYRRSHSSLGQSSYFFNYDNPQNYWGETIRSTTLSYNHEWTHSFSSSTNISSLLYTMDNNSSMGVSFIDYTDKVYRYSASRDFLLEQLFTVVPINGLEIISGFTYKYSSMLVQTNFLESPFNTREYSIFSTDVTALDPVTGTFGLNAMTFHNLSTFTQAYYSYNSLRLMGGLRFDHNSQYGNSLNPRLAALYIVSEKTRIKGSAGFAFKAPAASMAWQSLSYKTGENLDSLMYIAVPNTALEPERYMALEFGVDRTFFNKIDVNLSLYYNIIKNLIITQNVNVAELNLPLASYRNTTALSYINEKEARSMLYGLQTNIKIDDIIRSIKLKAEINLTFGRSSHEFPDFVELASDYLQFNDFQLVPNHYGQLRLSAEPVRNLYVMLSNIWESGWLKKLFPKDEEYEESLDNIDGFFSTDLVVDYKFGNNLSCFTKIKNVFNVRYGGPSYSGTNMSLKYNPQSGRNIQVGLKYTFN